ncbi:MAG: hypothetical protein IKX37_02720 [Bacteroidales bacterium]|nr:hypothetical protein [Bacteroidales bacterium]
MKRLFLMLCALLPLAFACKKEGKIEKIEAIDMGTGILWGNSNLGTENEYNFGLYYAWAAIATGGYFTWENCPYCTVKPDGSLDQITKYDANGHLESGDDAARVRLKDGWRLPTEEEMKALNGDDFQWEWIKEYKLSNGKVARDEYFHDPVSGIRVTNKNTGKSLFFPATGIGTDNGGSSRPGSLGGYWTSSSSHTDASKALGLKIEMSTASLMDMEVTNLTHSVTEFERREGLYIRPVKDKPAAE